MLARTHTIHTASPFKDLFPIRETELCNIAKDMEKNGFDKAQPIIVWTGHNSIVLDGHTRLEAAKRAKLWEVEIFLKDIPTEKEALEYAIKCQTSRRNLTDAEIQRCILELDKRRIAGRPSPEKLATGVANSGKSAEETAALLGINRGKVEKARTVIDHAPKEIQKAMESGDMSINAAYKATQAARREAGEIPALVVKALPPPPPPSTQIRPEVVEEPAPAKVEAPVVEKAPEPVPPAPAAAPTPVAASVATPKPEEAKTDHQDEIDKILACLSESLEKGIAAARAIATREQIERMITALQEQLKNMPK